MAARVSRVSVEVLGANVPGVSVSRMSIEVFAAGPNTLTGRVRVSRVSVEALGRLPGKPPKFQAILV